MQFPAMVRLGILVGFLVAAIPDSAAYAQPRANLAEHVPADCVLALTTSDLAATCEQFQQTRIGSLLSGPTFEPLVEELRRRHLGGPLHLRPVVGFDWTELRQTSGGSGLFVFPLADGALGLAWLFAGTPAESDGPLAVSANYFGQRGYRGETTRRDGLALTVMHPPEQLRDEGTRVLLAAGGFYGVTNSLAAADALAKVRPEQSLAAQTPWQREMPATAVAVSPGEVRFLIRPLPLWELARTADRAAASEPPVGGDKTPSDDARDPLAASRQLGFDALEALSGRIQLSAAPGSDWQITGGMLAARPLAKAMRLLALQSGPMPELDAAFADDLTSVSVWNWDFSTAMQGFGNLFDEANEPGPDGVGLFEDLLDGLRDDPEGVQVDLRREVFANLGPQIINVTDRKGPRTEHTPDGNRTLYVAQVRNEPVVAEALLRFYRDDDRVAHRRHGNYHMWTVPEGASLFVEGESDSVVSIRTLALGEGRIFFGTDEPLLLDTLAGGPTNRLRDQASWAGLWQSLRERVGDTGALWALARLDEMLAPAYRQATSEPPEPATAESKPAELGPAAALWRILLFGTADRQAEVPLAAAPSYDQLRPALPPVSMSLVPADDGWNIEINALRREE